MQTDLSNRFDLSRFPEPQRSRIAASLSDIVIIKLSQQLYDELPENEKKIFDHLEDNGSIEQSNQVWQFFTNHYPDIEQRIMALVQQEEAELADKLDAMLKLLDANKAK